VLCVVVAVCFLTNPLEDSWIKVTHGAASVELECNFASPINAYAIYEDIYESGELVSSEAIVFDNFQNEGGATPRRTTFSLSVQPVNSVGRDGYTGELSLNYGGAGIAHMTRKLPKEHYTDYVHVVTEQGNRIFKKQTLTTGDNVTLYSIVLSTDLLGIDHKSLVVSAQNNTLPRSKDTVVIYRLVTSENGEEFSSVNSSVPSVSGQTLSLNDVIILSQKGYDLTWADFEQFKYIETGFGLYIRRYEINDLFHFSIGGAGPNSNPMYMHLGVNGEDPDAYIDIREGGVTKFISEHNSDSSELWDRIPMVMVNGELYLDTGKESTVIARCGMMDGEITSQVPGNEEPTVNDQSNFGIGYGYQYGPIEGTIEINMNGKWWIFATEAVRQEIQFPTEGTDPELMIDPVVPVSVVNLITGEERIITSNADIRTIQMITSSEWWAEGNPGCDNDFKITINGETYWYHSDCGTLNDINNDRCISLDESKCKEINNIFGITQDLELERFYLTIGAEGVKTIELTMPNSIDACENEDGSLFKKGDRILLECLDGYKDLRGVSIRALGENGEILWNASIPDGEENEGFTHLGNDDWNITNMP